MRADKRILTATKTGINANGGERNLCKRKDAESLLLVASCAVSAGAAGCVGGMGGS